MRLGIRLAFGLGHEPVFTFCLSKEVKDERPLQHKTFVHILSGCPWTLLKGQVY